MRCDSVRMRAFSRSCSRMQRANGTTVTNASSWRDIATIVVGNSWSLGVSQEL